MYEIQGDEFSFVENEGKIKRTGSGANRLEHRRPVCNECKARKKKPFVFKD
jgi:hypothetical protein